jgi:hypothetical protein
MSEFSSNVNRKNTDQTDARFWPDFVWMHPSNPVLPTHCPSCEIKLGEKNEKEVRTPKEGKAQTKRKQEMDSKRKKRK